MTYKLDRELAKKLTSTFLAMLIKVIPMPNSSTNELDKPFVRDLDQKACYGTEPNPSYALAASRPTELSDRFLWGE
jgi:hypothetical protein